MYHYDYRTTNTCAQLISLDLDGDKVHNISFMGGCNGNLKAIPILVDGWTVDQIEEKLSGIECGLRKTSCGDQLAKAVREAYEAMKNGVVQNLEDDFEVIDKGGILSKIDKGIVTYHFEVGSGKFEE